MSRFYRPDFPSTVYYRPSFKTPDFRPIWAIIFLIVWTAKNFGLDALILSSIEKSSLISGESSFRGRSPCNCLYAKYESIMLLHSNEQKVVYSPSSLSYTLIL